MGTFLCMLGSTPDLVVNWSPPGYDPLPDARFRAVTLPNWSVVMCSWSPSPQRNRLKKPAPGEKRFHYIWDLDDGRPEHVRHTKRDKLKLFFDSDGDGRLTNDDVLIGRAKVKKPFRGLGRGKLLDGTSFGSITAFNAIDQSPTPGHVELSADVGLMFEHPQGGVAAIFNEVFLPYLA